MTEDEWKELLEEPPHGHNHGRKKSDQGTWTPLETDQRDQPSIKRPPVPTSHGTPYAWRYQKCRCEFCKLMQAQRMRVYRRRDSQG